jgi:predicted acyltransferase
MSDAVAPAAQISSNPPSSAHPASGRRLLSLDALRGFDMFWIVGGEEVVHGLYRAFPGGPLHLLDQQMSHKAWGGVAFYDLIFPLFVFIVGVSLVFSLSKTIQQHGKARAMRRILARSLILYVFGLLVYGGVSKGWENVRWMGVLQRIAIAYCFAGVLFCALKTRVLAGLCAALLIGYWALLALVPIRDFNLERDHLRSLNLTPAAAETVARFHATTDRVRGRYEDGLNLTQHLDFQYLPGHKWDGAYDPEGLLSTLPAIATCLLGVFAGLWIRRSDVSDQRKVLWLLGAGAAGVVLGFSWGIWFPVIKKIWTSSYVLVAAGYSCLFLAAFYQMVEIWGWRKWCAPFVWIGTNAITIYMVFHLLEVARYAELVVGGPIKAAFGRAGDLLVAVVVMIMMFAFVRFLYTRKIFLRL